MSRAKEAALKAYPVDVQLFVESQEESGKWLPVDENIQFRYGYEQGYEQAEKDMKERFIQFVHRHYPINYIGWIQDFQRAMEDEK